MERAGKLGAIDRSHFRVALWQIAVRALLRSIDCDVKRAVHRLQPKLRLLERGRREHGIGVVFLVSTYLPEFALGDVWGVDKTIVAPHQFFAQVVFHLLPDDPALRVPKDQALSVLILNRK